MTKSALYYIQIYLRQALYFMFKYIDAIYFTSVNRIYATQHELNNYDRDRYMNKFQTLSVSKRLNGVWQVSMNREDVFNAFNETMIEELIAAFDLLIADTNVRVIVLAGNGKHFSAGADLQWMKRASTASVEWNLNDARKFADMLSKIDTCPKPTVARIQGVALGGGTGLVCACDIAVAADNARFSVSEAKFGILPAGIGPYVINAVGKRQARNLALTTTRIDAVEAHRIGLVQRVATVETLDNVVDEVLGELLVAAPNAQHEIKQLFAQLSEGPITEEVKELTAQTISRVRSTEEAKEGFNAFLEKRPASWIPQNDEA
jgi:methylglutaconyl-CoA hydratase